MRGLHPRRLSCRAGAQVLLLIALGAIVPPLGASATPASVIVRVTDRLQPTTLTVAPGTNVVWRNDSGNRHRFRSTDHSGDADFDTGDLEPGESGAVAFPAPGRWTYVDERNEDDPAFQGTITVLDAGAGAGTASSGATELPGGAGIPPGAAAPTPGPVAGAPTTAAVGMAGRAFRPAGVTIAAGGTVTWRNDDDREHTVTATDGAWTSGTIAPGQTWSRRFPAAGTFPYLCLIHPEMRGAVAVAGAPGAESAPGAGGAPAPTPAAPTPTPAPSAAPPSARPAPTAPGTVDVAIVDFAFEPSSIEVAPGTTIRWTNRGQAPHTVTADDGRFDSGMVAAAATFSTRLERPGRYGYVCVLHPGMAASITVAGLATASSGPPSPTPAASTSPPVRTSTSSSPSPQASAVGEAPPATGVAAVDGLAPTQPPPGVLAGRAEAVEARASVDPAAGARLILVLAVVAGAVAAFGRAMKGSLRPR